MRFLFCTWPFAGDTMPMLAVASTLRSRGRQVAVFSHDRMRQWAVQAGATFFVASERCYSADYDGTDRPNWFTPVPRFVQELNSAFIEFQPDILVDGNMPLGVRLVAEMHGVPHGSLCVTGCPFSSVDLFPYGWSFPPPANTLERSMVRVAAQEFDRIIAPDICYWDALRAEHGLPPRGQHPWFSPSNQWLIVIPSTEAYEYVRSDLPLQGHFVGPVLWDMPSSDAAPEIPSTTRPLIFVTQGSTFTRDLSLIRLTLAALASEPVQVLVCTGRDYRTEELGPLPKNAIVTREIQLRAWLPKADLAIIHGGYGSIHSALLGGIPLIVFPFGADQPENAERVAKSGAGLRMNIGHCTPETLRQAVREVLNEPRFRQNARRIQASFVRHDGPSEAADLLEQLARTGAPVLREATELTARTG